MSLHRPGYQEVPDLHSSIYYSYTICTGVITIDIDIIRTYNKPSNAYRACGRLANLVAHRKSTANMF